jgi:hypothetical protein
MWWGVSQVKVGKQSMTVCLHYFIAVWWDQMNYLFIWCEARHA